MNNEELNKVLNILVNAVNTCSSTIEFLLDRVRGLEQEVHMLIDKMSYK